MSRIDLDELRERIQLMDFERGSPEQIAVWRQDVAEARANLVIEDMIPTADEDQMFAVMLEEGVPPSLMATVILRLYERVASPELENIDIHPEHARTCD
jgi:hypothetical protein